MQLPSHESTVSYRSSRQTVLPYQENQLPPREHTTLEAEDCAEKRPRGWEVSSSFVEYSRTPTEETILRLSGARPSESYLPLSSRYLGDLSFRGSYDDDLNQDNEMLSSTSTWGSGSQYSAGASSYPSSTSSTQSYYSHRPAVMTPSRTQQNLPSLTEMNLNSTPMYTSRSPHGRHHHGMGCTSSTGGYYSHPSDAMDISYTTSRPSLASPYTNLHSSFSTRTSYGHNPSYNSSLETYSPTVDTYAYSNGHSWPPSLPYPSGYPSISDTSSIGSGRRRRGNLPKHVTDILRAWFHEHLDHPYPTDEDKQMLIGRTNLSISQISNWFINARRRHWPQLKADRERTMQGQDRGYKSGLGK